MTIAILINIDKELIQTYWKEPNDENLDNIIEQAKHQLDDNQWQDQVTDQLTSES